MRGITSGVLWRPYLLVGVTGNRSVSDAVDSYSRNVELNPKRTNRKLSDVTTATVDTNTAQSASKKKLGFVFRCWNLRGRRKYSGFNVNNVHLLSPATASGKSEQHSPFTLSGSIMAVLFPDSSRVIGGVRKDEFVTCENHFWFWESRKPFKYVGQEHYDFRLILLLSISSIFLTHGRRRWSWKDQDAPLSANEYRESFW